MTSSAKETGSRRPWQFRLSTLLIAIAVIAAIVAIPLLIRDSRAPKTRFAPADVKILGSALHLNLPASTRLELGYYSHHRDTTILFRSTMSAADAKLLRNSLDITWDDRPEYSTSLQGWWLEMIDACDRFHKPIPRIVDMALTNPAGTSIVFCEPTSDEVCVYFKVSDYPSIPEGIVPLAR